MWPKSFESDEPSAPIHLSNENHWISLRIPEYAGRTFRWYPSDGVKEYKPDHPDQRYGIGDIDYRMNWHGYRCEEFSLKGPSICFVGCSITVGIGLPLHETWGWLFKTMVEEELGHPVIYWNLAHGAKSVSYAARTVYLSREIIEPDYLIAYLPDGSRDELHTQGSVLDLCGIEHLPVPRAEWPGLLRIMNDDEAAARLVRSLAMIDLSLHGSKTGFSWNHWAHTDNVRRAFDRYTAGRFISTRFRSNIEHQAKDRARDILHVGPISHRRFAETIFREIGHIVIDKIKENWGL